MSLGKVAAGARAALGGLSLALGEATVRKTYLQLALALLATTLLLYGACGWAVWELTDRDSAWWIPVRIAGLVIVLLATPVVALHLVHALFPLFSERLVLASLRARGSRCADGLVAGEGLPLLVSVGISLRRLLRFLGLSLGVLALSLIPVVGALIGPPLQVLLSARMLSGELLDPYLSMKGYRWKQQRAYLKAHRSALVGFGLPWTALFALPLVGALVFGLAQSAVARLVSDVLEPDPPVAPDLD